MSDVSGYLVVLAARGTQFGPGRNPRYRGIYRMPMWPSQIAVENPALEEYVFNATDDNGFITDLAIAQSLVERLRSSPRKFEIIYCAAVQREDEAPTANSFLGYDIVPVGGDFLSIVGCPPDDRRLDGSLGALDANGLFADNAFALRFLDDYVRLQLPEWDVPRRVFRVELVTGKRNSEDAG